MVCDSCGSRQMGMQAYPLGSLLAEITKSGNGQHTTDPYPI